nr:PREDICTED: uncharacterized protein LOC103313859 [Tribolium castaneum]|eukprot:XP_008196415.2 PREDICTED: uncharacterized protein LOC103313859 [Tribolium castaneum]
MGYKEKSVEGWKKFIRNRMGDEIFEFYSRNGFLKKSLRIQLVNATTSELVRMYGISVPEFAKRNLGQAIISIFPKLRNPCGPTGYEAFYKNDNGGKVLLVIGYALSRKIPKMKTLGPRYAEGSAKLLKTRPMK